MSPPGVSLREVALLAGVSQGTASRVLSGSSYSVSERTRRKVEDAAAALGYVTNSAARALVTGRSAIVGAIVHDITDPYFSSVVRGLQDEAVAAGLVVLVGNDDRDPEKLESYLTMMLSQKPAGVVLVGGQVRDSATSLRIFQAVQRLRSQGIPVAAVGRYELDIPHVTVDDAAAAHSAVSHLLSLGHRRIGFAGGPPRSTTIEDRYGGYAAALSEAGIPVDRDLVVEVPMTLAGGARAAELLVAADVGVTAIFAATDEVAFGVVSGLRDKGLRVPQDVSVVGMDDVPMAAHADPPLTTIHVPARDLGVAAWQLLTAPDEGEDVCQRRIAPVELVVRASTAPPRPAQARKRPAHSPRQLGRMGDIAYGQ
jgi:LacI family transcriptional regulator